jgi:hypothetical protein
MDLADLIEPGRVVYAGRASNKEQLLRDLASRVATLLNLDAQTICNALQMSTGAISLHAARGSRMARVVVAFECFLDRKGIISVVAGRDLSRQVVKHCPQCTIDVPTLPCGYPHARIGEEGREGWRSRSIRCD